MSSSLMTATRRPKWQYPQPQPTPRILQLPRRPRRKASKSNFLGKSNSREKKGKLEALFYEEREFTRGVFPVVVMSCGKEEEEEERRERVEMEEERESTVEEEKWRFQAEMLRAECNLLRMEKEIAVKKMERRKVHVERILRSSIQALVSGRNKIYDGENVGMVLEEEIKNLVEKLEKLQRRTGVRNNNNDKFLEVKRNCSNFDKQASLLQRRLVRVRGTSDETCVKEIQEMAEASLSIKTSCRADESFVSNENCHVEILRRKMEGLSKGVLLERMEEEYGPMLTSANSSAASSTSNSRRIELPDPSLLSIRHQYKEAVLRAQEETVCSGHCKVIVRRIVEQVRAETEQWSQMQEMLGQVRDEIEELQTSRDFWEDRALDSDYQIQSLVSAVQEWRHKAHSWETKANELQTEMTMLQKEIEQLKERETCTTRAKISSPLSRDSQNEMEKRVLVCRMKENHHHHHRSKENGVKPKEAFHYGRRNTYTSSGNGLSAPKRSPLGDISNMSPLTR